MTIRKGQAGDPEQHEAEADRVRRPQPAATGPKRARTAADTDPQSTSPAPAPDEKVGDAVAHAVKLGYDVVAENIRQGREAAARFSKGKYNIREAPGDLEAAAQRLLHLARELSTTTFDVCERLLREFPTQKPPTDRAAPMPGFRAQQAAPPSPPKPAQAPPAGPPVMKVTVRFDGAPGAIAHTVSLERPRSPAAPADVIAQPLAPGEGPGEPLAGVTFETDVSVEGIIARVTVPSGQAPGVYSGLVRVKGDPIPLGVLTIELPK